MIPPWARRGLLLLLLGLAAFSSVRQIIYFVHRHRGEEALTAAELGQAHTSLAAAAAWRPEDAPTRILQARVLRLALANGLPVPGHEAGDDGALLAAGVQHLAAAIHLNPADAWAWFNVAELHGAHQRGRERLERLRAAGEENPEPDPGEETAPAGGEERVASGGDEVPARPVEVQPEDPVVAAAARKALEREPAFYFYHDFLARLYAERGFKDAAREEIRQAFALMPDPSVHPILAAAGLLEPFAGAALAGMEEAGRSGAFPPAVLVRARAELHRRLGQIEAAVQAFLELRALGGEEAHAECDLAVGMLLFGAGRHAEALPYLERVIAAGSGTRGWDVALYHRAAARRETGDDAGALADLEAYRRGRPDSLAALLALGRQLERMGRAGEAEQTYRVGTRRFPGEPGAHLALASLLERQQRWSEALAAARVVEEIAPEEEQTQKLLQRLRKAAGAAGR